jgi:hypothetical protein
MNTDQEKLKIKNGFPSTGKPFHQMAKTNKITIKN